VTQSSRSAPHRSLENIGPEGQHRIEQSNVLLIGLGGLGNPIAAYLAGSGVGTLQLCDFDTVSESNLARQFLFSSDDVGHTKVQATEKRLAEQYPETVFTLHNQRSDDELLAHLLPGIDLLIDASDNYGSRLASNRACLANGIPWVTGSCIRMEGQAVLFETADEHEPCYRCIYGVAPETLEDCPGAGIFAPVAGITGSIMAHLALARLAGLKFKPRLHMLDAAQMEWRSLATRRNPDCPACSGN
jgi:adenylyltransferase/sulfurtransferase